MSKKIFIGLIILAIIVQACLGVLLYNFINLLKMI